MPVTSVDPLGLQRGLRELVALSALPAAWRHTPTTQIPDNLAEVLLRGLGAEFIFFRMTIGPDGRQTEGVRQARETSHDTHAVREALLAYAARDDEAPPPAIANSLEPDATLQLAVQRIGADGGMGLLIAACARPDFPSQLDRVLLEVGANQAAVVLQHRQAEEAVKQSDLRWTAAIVEDSNDAIIGKTLDGIVTSWNPGAEQLYGYSAQEMIGRHIRTTAPPERANEAMDILERIKRGERVHRYDTQRVTKAGRLIDVSLMVSGIRAASGALIGASIIARDIGERKRAEAGLRALLDAAPDATVIADSSGRVLMVNARVEPLLGYGHELLGQPVEILVPHHARRMHVAHRQDYARAAHPRPMGAGLELTAVRKDGTEVPVEISLSPVDTEEGTLVVAAIRDVTDRKRLTEALRLSTVHLRHALEVSHLGSWEVSIPPAPTDHWSEQTSRILGWSAADGLRSADDLRRIVHPDDQARLSALWSRAIRDLTRFDAECRIIRPDGEPRIVHSVGEPLKAGDGTTVTVIGTLEDVTDRRRAEHALRDAEVKLAHISRVATMGELASSIAHEINQPLAAIVNDGAACLRWLQSRPPALAEAKESVQHIIGDANRASQVIARIRTLLARKPSARSPFDPNELVRDTLALVMGEIARVGATLRSDLTSELPPVLGDRIQIQQVLLNLLMNALDAMSRVTRRPRELTVASARGAASTVVIAVRDSGEGIPSDLRDRIFEPFYTTKLEGLGMGLAISRSIIEEHGGHLWALEHDGAAGATVQFTIPVADGES